jgi:hypothetical protein
MAGQEHGKEDVFGRPYVLDLGIFKLPGTAMSFSTNSHGIERLVPENDAYSIVRSLFLAPLLIQRSLMHASNCRTTFRP